MISLYAFLVRKEGLSHDEFRHYWHEVHGPFIRDTPELAGPLLRYEQHPRLPESFGGADQYDGVAVQSFESWETFGQWLTSPAAEAMRADEANFLDAEKLTVVFTEEPVVMVPFEGYH